jgi:hypothetical protein
MNPNAKLQIAVHPVATITDRLEFVQRRVTQRAYERFLRPGAEMRELPRLQNEAEIELIYEPPIEVRESTHGVWVTISCPELNPAELRLFAAPRDLLVLAPLREAGQRWLCRCVQFQTSIDIEDCSCEYTPNRISFTAARRNLPEEQKFRFQVA